MGLFVVLSASAMLMWKSEKMHAITGDEPHYLVIADGLLPTFELEQTGPYTREFQNRTIVESGLAPRDAVPSTSNTHGEVGPRGLFNVHNIGLPALLAIPYLLGGELGARIAMILMGSLVVLLLRQFLSLTSVSKTGQVLISLPLAIGLPFISGATQIYPDLPGGIICLSGIYFLFRGPRKDKPHDGVIIACVLAFLPWLHIRFSLPMAVVLGALMIRWRELHTWKSLLFKFATPATVSVALLAMYNVYAFGHASGPYQSGDVMLNRIAIMQFLGLLFDQNQGIAIQQPLHFVGLLYLAYLLRRQTIATATTIIVALSLIGPNATHWNLYGGWSFSGRFGWAAATVLLSLTTLATAKVWSDHRKTAFVVIGIALAIQIRHLIAIFIQKRTLFPHIFDGWIGTYSTFWSPIEAMLPQFRDYRWAFTYVPNLVVIAIGISILLVGWSTGLTRETKRGVMASISFTSIALLGLYGRFGDLPFPIQKWAGSQLSSSIGKIDNLSRTAEPQNGKGLLTYGPYWEVPKGDYEVGIRYRSDGTEDVNGILDVFIAEKNIVITAVDLPSTRNITRDLYLPISISDANAGKIELRTMYEGKGTLTVDWIQLRRVSGNQAE